MAATVAHETDTAPYPTREEFDALREELRLVLAGAERFFEAGAAWASRPAHPGHLPRPPHPSRTGARPDLTVVTDASVALILEAARR